MFRAIHILLAICLFTYAGFATSADESFPGRDKYPDVKYVELEDLYQQKLKNEVIIVDARSNYEYETLRIKGSVNIPVANKDFEVQIEKLRNKTDKPIVFYCNGHRCMKSYIAAKKCMDVGMKDVIAFDAGVFDWTRKYPKESVLLGTSPVDPNHLIASKHFKSRLLNPDKFSEFIVSSPDQRIVIDVRDKFQRAGIGFYPGIERWAALDDREKLQRYIEKAKRENKTLFIYDEVGSQVRWLQYALEKAGVKKYYFMEKGARAYYDMMAAIEWNKR